MVLTDHLYVSHLDMGAHLRADPSRYLNTIQSTLCCRSHCWYFSFNINWFPYVNFFYAFIHSSHSFPVPCIFICRTVQVFSDKKVELAAYLMILTVGKQVTILLQRSRGFFCYMTSFYTKIYTEHSSYPVPYLLSTPSPPPFLLICMVAKNIQHYSPYTYPAERQIQIHRPRWSKFSRTRL